MRMQLLTNLFLNFMPISLAGIIFISLLNGIAVSKIKYIS